MPVPVPTLRHVLPCSTPNPNIVFASDDIALHSTNGRIQRTDANHGRMQTLPFEATRNIKSLSYGKNRLLITDDLSRAYIFIAPFTRPYARLSLRFKVLNCKLSPCGRYGAFLGDKLEIWNIPKYPVPSFQSWTKLCEFAPGATSTACISWSVDSKRVAVGLTSGSCMIYTLIHERMSGVHVKHVTLYGHRSSIVNIQFIGRNGIVSVSEDGALFCWRLKFHDEESTKPADADGKDEHGEEAGEPKEGGVYKPQEYEFVRGVPTRNPKRKLYLVPVSARLVSKHFVKQGGAKRVTSCDVMDPLLVTGLSNGLFALYELPDAMTREDQDVDQGLFEMKEKKSEASQDPSEDDEDGEIAVKFTDLILLQTLNVTGGAISRIKFNDSGSWIAMSSSASGQIIIWDWRNETHVLKQQGHSLTIESTAFSPDGRAIATGGNDGKLKLWNTSSGFCITTFSNHESKISSIIFSSSDVIVSASYDGTVRAYDIRRYRNFRTLVGPTTDAAGGRRKFESVAADSSGDLIAAGCAETFEIVVWSLRTGQLLEVLAGHTGPLSAITFRPRRGNLVSSSWDKTVRVWDMYERKGGCEVLEENKEVLDVAVKPNGKEVATCALSGEIHVWDLEAGAIVCTIDGARDCSGGRLKTSKTKAPEKGYFQAVRYSVDGHFLVAGAANAKFVCFYHISDRHQPMLVRRIAITVNQHFDGLLTQLNSRHFVADAGVHAAEIEDDDEDAEGYGAARRAQQGALPGAQPESELRRRQLVQAQVKQLAMCGTGRLLAAVTGEGVLIYSTSQQEGQDDDADDIVFDPTHLDAEVSKQSIAACVRDGQPLRAVLLALRLNERPVLNAVIEQVAPAHIDVAVRQVGPGYLNRLVALFAWRLEHTPHIEFNLAWARALLLHHGEAVKTGTLRDVVAVHASLRALHRACLQHSRRITPVADQNQAMLSYLLAVSNSEGAAAK